MVAAKDNPDAQLTALRFSHTESFPHPLNSDLLGTFMSCHPIPDGAFSLFQFPGNLPSRNPYHPMSQRAVLISIKPMYADLIFAGTKTIELRRVCPKVGPGDLVLV
jgi:hypothetical protein